MSDNPWNAVPIDPGKILGWVCAAALLLLAGCAGAVPHAADAPLVLPTATQPQVFLPSDTPAPVASATAFALPVELGVHALCAAPWKAEAAENSCPQLLALYPDSAELEKLSTLPPAQWPKYPAVVLGFDPSTQCIFVREADGRSGWTGLAAVEDPGVVETILRTAPPWNG